MPQLRSYTEATNLLPTDGFWIDRIGAGTMWIDGLNTLLGVTRIAFEFLGGPPTGGVSPEVMGGVSISSPMTIPANFQDAPNDVFATGFCLVNPTGTFVITVQQNGSTIGTITISTAGAFTFATSGGVAVNLAAGDKLTFVAQSSVDASLSNVFWTIMATLT